MAGKRRSLLADAIESLGAGPAGAGSGAPSPAPEAGLEAPTDDDGGPTPPAFLARRAQSLGEVSRTVKRPTIRLLPSECSIWPGNARDYADLSFERCESLIASIQEEGRNREAVVVRRTPDGPAPYELIVGTRRHWSISWLHANNHSEIELIARIETLDDEGAFRLADIENREREDVTDLERARNYLHAVEAYYGGVRARMAERLAMPQTTLYNFLRLGELPDPVIAAFPSKAAVKAVHANRIAPHWKGDLEQARILAEAAAITDEQQALRANGDKPIEAAKVCERLIRAAKAAPAKRQAGKAPALLFSNGGEPLGQIVSDSARSGLTLTIKPAAALSVDEILEALRPAIAAAKFARDL
jgi:ParB family transcriptional regulator, chromosome partitioning protein